MRFSLGRRTALALLGIPCALLGLGFYSDRADLFPDLRYAIHRSLPGASTVSAAQVARGLPLISVEVEHEDLYGAQKGLLRHPRQTGADWERPALVTYYDKGQMLYFGSTGIRIHGGGSRILSPRQSFRLYFRRRYGARALERDLIFDGQPGGIRHLVLHNDVRQPRKIAWHFANPLAYDIARAMGCITPDTKPVRFFLNGEFQGVYVLTEHIRTEFLQRRFGHTMFTSDTRAFGALLRWLRGREPLTMAKVSRVIDLDNLTRWYLSVLFCGTHDALQGSNQFRDDTKTPPSWFWVNWDMDQSFRNAWDEDSFQLLFARIAEGQRGRRPSEPRSLIFTSLFAEDPEYREFFKKRFVEVMNYRVTPAFLEERFQYYADIAARYGVAEREFLEPFHMFLRNRPAALRALAEQYLNTDPSVTCHVVTASPAQVTIDGTTIPRDFRGYYFPGMTIDIALLESEQSRLLYWKVDGQPMRAGPVLKLHVTHDVTVEPVLGP